MQLGRVAGAAGALRVLSGRSLRTRSGIVFAYHDVGERSNDPEYLVSTAQFADHLAWSEQWGLRFVGLSELVDALVAGDNVDGLASVTFDDALLGLHENAVEVLGRTGISATVFVVAKASGEDPWWWPGGARTLTPSELRGLVSAGHRIGSHTLTHASLPALDDDALDRELRDSRARLEDVVGTSVDLLAYPSGHHDARVRAAAARAGYRAGFTFHNGRVDSTSDLFALPRLTMSARQGRTRLAYQLARPSSSWPEARVDATP